ncbi:uncharacterized protein LOC141618564 [Silene latifolia]|uniref:uncharacterized protein LOC141618564 n=1 Tax=Silene latifolia TaxID=37657 RepID=UPI003D78528F
MMVTQSLVKGYVQQGISPRCMIKVDIKKAFDSLQWTFIDQMLIKVNGDNTGFFKGECGLRQGDPLFPFLFVMSMEIISRLLRKIHRDHQVSFHPKCGKLGLNHLIFADDLMLFVRGDVPSVQAGSDEGHRKLIMKSWASCCVPHAEGGFNIKEVLAWNKCILCKWIWIIDTHSDSLWVNWNHTYNIKTGDFWTMAAKNYHSESWKNLLTVRYEIVAKTGSIATARAFLLDCIAGGKMRLHRVYDFLRVPGRRISWAQAVWNKAVVPKHSFLAVLAMQRKLATIDQLTHRGMHLVNRCVLCKAANEDHSHIFFSVVILATFGNNCWTGWD